MVVVVVGGESATWSERWEVWLTARGRRRDKMEGMKDALCEFAKAVL
jgi:hypothetical protein